MQLSPLKEAEIRTLLKQITQRELILLNGHETEALLNEIDHARNTAIRLVKINQVLTENLTIVIEYVYQKFENYRECDYGIKSNLERRDQ